MMRNSPKNFSPYRLHPSPYGSLAKSALTELLGVLFMFWCLAAPHAQAQTTVEPEPDTIIVSDSLHHDDVKRQSTFTGDVIMTRGQLVLHADNLHLSEDAEGFQFAVATLTSSDRVRVRQENPDDFEVIRAEGLRGEWDGKNEELEMIGQAVITRYVCGKPVDEVRGERVIYYQKTDTYEAFSGPDSAADDRRVRSVVRPRAVIDQAIKECREQNQP